MIKFQLIHPRATHEMLGFIPEFLSANDSRPAKEQIHSAYAHGGGWHSFPGFKMTPAGLAYHGDSPMPLLAEARLRQEIVRIYDCAWVAIVQPDGSYDVARID